MIGSNNDPSKWRCKICKFLYSDYEEQCQTCKEHRQEIYDKDLCDSIKTTASKKKEIPKHSTVQNKLSALKVIRKLEETEEEALKVLI